MLNRSPDFLIFVEGSSSTLRLGPEIAAYNAHRRPRDRANFTLQGFVDRLEVGDERHPAAIETPAEFFRRILEPDYRAFLAAPTDLRLAFHAASSLFHLRDWVAAAKGLKGAALQADLEARCDSFGVIRDVANAGKHLLLDKYPSTNMRQAGEARLQDIATGGYGAGPGGYGHAMAYGSVPAIVIAPDGVIFGRAASEVHKMWTEYLDDKK
jgi:hypothetical protein